MYKIITGISIFFTAVVASLNNTSAQSIMATTGDYSLFNGGYSVSFTLGESFIQQPLYFSNGFICEGFQQGFWETNAIIYREVKVFPNPITKGKDLNIALPIKEHIKSYYISVISVTGQVLEVFPSVIVKEGSPIKYIPFNSYGKGLYLIKIVSDNGEYNKTFKIEKL